MQKFLLSSVAVAVLLAWSGKTGAQENSYARPELLMEATSLAGKLGDSKLRLLDARSRANYRTGHIPGAVWVDVEAWAKAFASGPKADDWAARIGQVGVDRDLEVVVYGDGLSPDAARVWWILRYWGFPDVRLLNGGWKAWTAARGPVSTEVPTVAATQPQLHAEPNRLATKDQILQSLRDGHPQIVDARSRNEFCGIAGAAKRKGAIPGAVHLEWSEVVDPKTQRLKSAAEIRQIFQTKHIDLNQPIVTHCQSGGRASVMAFALELMGAKEARNYYRSWAEWGNADETPVIQPEKP